MASAKHRLLGLAVVATWFLCPLPQPSAIKTVDVERPGPASFTVLDERIVCARTSDEMLLRACAHLSKGQVQIDLLDLDEKVLAGPFVLTGDKTDSLTFVTNEGFPRGRTYRLRCTEQEVVGRYRLSISQPWRITLGQRYLAAVSALAVGLAVTAGLGVFSIGGARMRRMGAGFGWYLFLATFWLVYPVVHEAGHVLALLAFDAWEPAGTSLLPFGGQVPHVAGRLSADLAPWQTAVAAIAGPLLPTLLGYVSFALWISPFGRRWRSQRLRADLGWSLLTVTLVFSQAVPAPMLFPNAVHDRDYSVFVQNVGLPLWIANSAIAAVAVVNLAVVAWIVKHLFRRIRAARRANLSRRERQIMELIDQANRKEK